MATSSETLKRAQALHHAGNGPDAERAYRDVLIAEPRQFDALHGLGVLLAQNGRFDEALTLVERALQVIPRSNQAQASRANVLQALDRHAEALLIWNDILKAEASPLAHYNRGNALLALGRHVDALADYDAVIRLMPDNAAALYNRGFVLQHLRRF